MPSPTDADWLETLHEYVLFFFTKKGISKRDFMDEYTFYEVINLIVFDLRDQARTHLIQIMIQMSLLSVLDEKASKDLQKQINELMKVAGVESDKKVSEPKKDFNSIQNMLMSFQNARVDEQERR